MNARANACHTAAMYMSLVFLCNYMYVGMNTCSTRGLQRRHTPRCLMLVLSHKASLCEVKGRSKVTCVRIKKQRLLDNMPAAR